MMIFRSFDEEIFQNTMFDVENLKFLKAFPLFGTEEQRR